MHSTIGVCVMYAYAAWHQMVPICMERWCTEANEATQTHCYNPVVPAYPVWAYYAHGPQRRCQEDPVSLPSGRLEKTTRLSPETAPPYAPQSSRFGSEPPSVEDDVDVWCYTILEVHAGNVDDMEKCCVGNIRVFNFVLIHLHCYCISAAGDSTWVISAEDRAKHNAQFEQLKPVDGFVTGIFTLLFGISSPAAHRIKLHASLCTPVTRYISQTNRWLFIQR